MKPPSRRGFLSGLLTALAFAAPAAATGAVAQATASRLLVDPEAKLAPALTKTGGKNPPVNDDAELMALGARLNETFRAYAATVGRKLEIKAEFAKRCPVPDELLADWPRVSHDLRQYANDERDLEGERIHPPAVLDEKTGDFEDPPPRLVLDAGGIEAYIAHWAADGRTKHGKEIRARLRVAEQYEAAKIKAIEDLQWEAARGACFAAEYEFECVLERVWHAKATTFAGLVVKAEAIALTQSLPSTSWMSGWGHNGTSLANCIMAMQRRAAA